MFEVGQWVKDRGEAYYTRVKAWDNEHEMGGSDWVVNTVVEPIYVRQDQGPILTSDIVVRDQHMIDWLNLQIVKARILKAAS